MRRSVGDGRTTVRAAFDGGRAAGRALLFPYLTAGLPDTGSSADLFVAMADAGADGFEVGFPYSDPLMDGPTIQAAGSRALAGGAGFVACLSIVDQVVARTDLPVFVMTYANPVLRRGATAFATAIAGAGASGLIVADLPVDEAAPFAEAANAVGLGLVLFVAPTTDDGRLRRVLDADPLFVYAVARLGVTGEGPAVSRLAGLVDRVRATGEVPVVAGVGIATPDQAAEAARHADGVIVGSALVRRVLEAPSPDAAAKGLHEAVGELIAAMRRR